MKFFFPSSLLYINCFFSVHTAQENKYSFLYSALFVKNQNKLHVNKASIITYTQTLNMRINLKVRSSKPFHSHKDEMTCSSLHCQCYRLIGNRLVFYSFSNYHIVYFDVAKFIFRIISLGQFQIFRLLLLTTLNCSNPGTDTSLISCQHFNIHTFFRSIFFPATQSIRMQVKLH